MRALDVADVGKRVRAKREANGLTQEKLALKIGITGRHLYDIERGKKAMSVLVLHELRAALDVSSDWLLDGK